MSTRIPNVEERKRWEQFLTRKQIYDLKIEQATAEKRKCLIIRDFVVQQGFPVPPNLENQFNQASSQLEVFRKKSVKLSNIIQGVNDEVLALKYPPNSTSDFNIVALRELNADEQEAYNLDGVLVFIGIVAVATIVTATYYYIKEATAQLDMCNERFVAIDSVANSKFCEDPNSETCRRWLEFREAQGYQHQNSIIENIKSSISNLMSSLEEPLSTGLSWGIPILVAVGAIALFAGRR